MMFRVSVFALWACILVQPIASLTPYSGENAAYSAFIQQRLAGAHNRHQILQPSDVTTSKTSETWFERMGNAFAGVLAGIVMIVFSVPVLFINEKRNAKAESLINVGEQEVHQISADDFDSKNTHWLVLATGDTSSTKPVKDQQFNVQFEKGVAKLHSVVEIYQWKEIERKETKEKTSMTGTKTKETKTWYEYKKDWSSTYNAGESFKKPEHKNTKPTGLDAGMFRRTCECIEFGSGFLLQEAELDQLPANEELDMKEYRKFVCEKNSSLSFVDGDGGKYKYYYGGASGVPQVGDARVSFKVLRDGPATVLGLQNEAKEKGKGTFLPYRVIRRPPCPCFGLTEEQEKQALYDEAKRDKDDIVDEDIWHGGMACFCCACNLVQYCCMRGLMPELHYAFASNMSKSAVFKDIRARAAAMVWILRLVGWLLMFIGLCLLFGPITEFLTIIPFIGGFLSSFGNMIVGVASFLVTLVVSIVIVALAYILYRPLYGIMILAVAVAIVAGVMALSSTQQPQ